MRYHFIQYNLRPIHTEPTDADQWQQTLGWINVTPVGICCHWTALVFSIFNQCLSCRGMSEK